MVGGVDVWTRPWKSQGEDPIQVQHPTYPRQQHQLARYFIEAAGKTHEFAAGEVSPGVWLFFTPSRASTNLVLLRVGAYVAAVAGVFILLHGFEQSVTYIALGSTLIAAGLAVDWYARTEHRVSEA